MNMKKFSSRKFLACVAGIITGFVVLLSGNVTEGVATVITSVVTYLAVEGFIDAKAVQKTAENVVDMLETTPTEG
jgi:hypothetical protein